MPIGRAARVFFSFFASSFAGALASSVAAVGLCALTGADALFLGAGAAALRSFSGTGAAFLATSTLAMTALAGFFSGCGRFLLVAVGFGLLVMVKLVRPRIKMV